MTFSIETIAQLDHSKEFAHLHQKFHQFNPLKVLRVDQFEIRHSNVLAWLLDPNENHHLGNFFVKQILSRLVTRQENEDKLVGIDFLSYMHASFSDAEIYREVKTHTSRYIDLVVVLPSHKLVLVIENKFHAFESLGQLDDYLEYARTVYKDFKVIPIFLTLRSDTPTHSEYLVLDYNDILEIILLHTELNREVMSESIFDFLMHYTAILKEELVQDEDAIQLAQDVYQSNKAAVDFLYLSQHDEFRKHPRYREIYQSVDGLSIVQMNALKRIYEKKKQTIDYIFKIGSSILHEAFLSFVQLEDLPADVYKAHAQVPNFILPEWLDFTDVIGKPEQGYWRGHGLIIWFERTWDERLKINIEVGPVPYENRLKLLNALETQGITIRPSAKLEGKKYTKIYTETLSIIDWANKQEVVTGMETLYHADNLKNTLRKIAKAVEIIENNLEQEVQEERLISERTYERFPQNPFLKFAQNHGIVSSLYRVGNKNASFLMTEFRELEKSFGVTREKWWWHDSTFTYWFERLRDDRLKLTLELGPLQADKRLKMINQLEESGIVFSAQSKLPTSRYTRLFSKSVFIENWNDEEELYREMVRLFEEDKNQELLEIIKSL
ncbi:PD-(D/E)XK nuclease family protein [Bacillus sp. ISL-55]|uniref:PDDEXK-like family protein n=1 Tax=Bacillus sp. ISL-55 TaxID=2819134 RepID=UPI001BE6D59C|nr:PD-(D/E)XK nuclease family protein [Bacillus sp. ISL-55]